MSNNTMNAVKYTYAEIIKCNGVLTCRTKTDRRTTYNSPSELLRKVRNEEFPKDPYGSIEIKRTGNWINLKNFKKVNCKRKIRGWNEDLFKSGYQIRVIHKNGNNVGRGKEELKEAVALKKKALKDAQKLVAKYKKEFPEGTPLVYACEKGRLEDVRLLVEGHDVEKTGMSVEEMVSKIGKESRYGLSRTPLQSAAENDQLEIVQFLVKCCPSVDLIGQTNSEYGQNSLHLAAIHSWNNVQTLQFLIDNYNGNIKTIINQKTKYGYTPLDYAYNEYNDSPIKNETVSLLRKYGGKANLHDKNGNGVGEGKGDLNDFEESYTEENVELEEEELEEEELEEECKVKPQEINNDSSKKSIEAKINILCSVIDECIKTYDLVSAINVLKNMTIEEYNMLFYTPNSKYSLYNLTKMIQNCNMHIFESKANKPIEEKADKFWQLTKYKIIKYYYKIAISINENINYSLREIDNSRKWIIVYDEAIKKVNIDKNNIMPSNISDIEVATNISKEIFKQYNHIIETQMDNIKNMENNIIDLRNKFQDILLLNLKREENNVNELIKDNKELQDLKTFIITIKNDK